MYQKKDLKHLCALKAEQWTSPTHWTRTEATSSCFELSACQSGGSEPRCELRSALWVHSSATTAPNSSLMHRSSGDKPSRFLLVLVRGWMSGWESELLHTTTHMNEDKRCDSDESNCHYSIMSSHFLWPKSESVTRRGVIIICNINRLQFFKLL